MTTIDHLNPPTGHMADNVVGFARALRAAGIPVGPGAVIDALNALQAIEIGHRAGTIGREEETQPVGERDDMANRKGRRRRGIFIDQLLDRVVSSAQEKRTSGYQKKREKKSETFH